MKQPTWRYKSINKSITCTWTAGDMLYFWFCWHVWIPLEWMNYPYSQFSSILTLPTKCFTHFYMFFNDIHTKNVSLLPQPLKILETGEDGGRRMKFENFHFKSQAQKKKRDWRVRRSEPGCYRSDENSFIRNFLRTLLCCKALSSHFSNITLISNSSWDIYKSLTLSLLLINNTEESYFPPSLFNTPRFQSLPLTDFLTPIWFHNFILHVLNVCLLRSRSFFFSSDKNEKRKRSQNSTSAFNAAKLLIISSIFSLLFTWQKNGKNKYVLFIIWEQRREETEIDENVFKFAWIHQQKSLFFWLLHVVCHSS